MRHHPFSCSSPATGATPVRDWHPDRCLYLEPTTSAQRLAGTDIPGFGKAIDTLLHRMAGGGERNAGAVEIVGRTRQGGYRVQLYAAKFGPLVGRLGTSDTLTLPSFGRWTRKPTPATASISVVVRGVPLSTFEADAQADIASSNAGRLEGFAAAADIATALQSVTRLKRRRAPGGEGPPWVPSTSLRLRVDCRLGEALLERGSIVLGYRLRPLALYEEPLLTCFNCGREGHVSKFCRSPPHCGGCGGRHALRDCPHRSPGVRGGAAPPATQ
jgi:hypothetical protein